MDIIVRANERVFKEVRRSMCDALVELMQDVIDEKVAEGRIEVLLEQIRKKIAKGKTVEQIADELEETVENIKILMTKVN